MNIQFLGTGSAFCKKNYQTNFLIQEDGKRLLIDAGTDIRWSLNNLAYDYRDIDAIYITHLHADHIGGLEYIALSSYFAPKKDENGNPIKIQLFGNADLINELWNSSLKGGLKCIQGKQTTLLDFFDVTMVQKNSSFIWEKIEFKIVQSVHVMDGYSIVPSYGLMFKDAPTRKTIYVTGDTQFNPNQIMDFYRQADVIIQDCETSPFKSGVHAHYEELKTLPIEIKKKMVLTHFGDNVIEDTNALNSEWVDKARDDGFFWFAPKGGILDTYKFESYF